MITRVEYRGDGPHYRSRFVEIDRMDELVWRVFCRVDLRERTVWRRSLTSAQSTARTVIQEGRLPRWSTRPRS